MSLSPIVSQSNNPYTDSSERAPVFAQVQQFFPKTKPKRTAVAVSQPENRFKPMKETLTLTVRQSRPTEFQGQIEIKIPNSEVEQAIDSKSCISSVSTMNNAFASVYQAETKIIIPQKHKVIRRTLVKPTEIQMPCET